MTTRPDFDGPDQEREYLEAQVALPQVAAGFSVAAPDIQLKQVVVVAPRNHVDQVLSVLNDRGSQDDFLASLPQRQV